MTKRLQKKDGEKMAKRKPMTLDEAIEHALERSHQDCSECAREHRQLAEWLSELKELREKQKG